MDLVTRRKASQQLFCIGGESCGESSNSNIIVHLLNPHSHSITVHKKTGIATLEEINSVCVVSEGAAKCMNESDEVPEDKKQMFLEMVSKCSPELSDEEKDQLLHFLLTYFGIFAGPGEGGGRTDKLMHKIDTGDAHPIRQAARCIPHTKKKKSPNSFKICYRKTSLSGVAVRGPLQLF